MVTPLEEPRPWSRCPARTSVPLAHDGTEHRPPHDPAEQTDCYSGKKRTTRSNVLLVNALLLIPLLSDTHGGRTHDLRIAEITSTRSGREWVVGSGLLSFTLPEMEA